METQWQFIMQEYETEYYCIICGCDIFGICNVKGHFYGNRHADALDTYGGNISSDDGRYQYYCDLCDCTISGYINVRGHLTGKRHSNALEDSESESETSEESVQWEAMKDDDFLLRYTDTHDEYVCFLCDKEFTDRWEASKHLYSWDHRDAFRVYGSKILCSKPQYYCQLCECYMSSWKNVSDHLYGGRHENNM